MSDEQVLTLDAWVQMKRRYTPILICREADRAATQVLADRMNEATRQVGTGGLPVQVEVNAMIPAGLALFKPPQYSRAWPLPDHEGITLVKLYPQGGE